MHFIRYAILLSLLVSCVSDRSRELAELQANPCSAWISELGEGHECTNSEGGALNSENVRRDITQKVVTEGFILPEKEYGMSILAFNSDGSYQARKLHFTNSVVEGNGRKTYLVYAEDSKGVYTVAKDGAITLQSPQFSTCKKRIGLSQQTIKPHLRTIQRQEPYRAIVEKKVKIAFSLDGWLRDFAGDEYWFGAVLNRQGFKMPPFPRSNQPLGYVFDDGLDTHIYYGCLDQGFATFDGQGEANFVKGENRTPRFLLQTLTDPDHF